MKARALLLTFSCLLVSCSGNHSTPDGCKAVEALKRVQAATQVGTTLDLYISLVADAKADANRSLPLLEEGPLKTGIRSSLDNYVDGLTVWRMKILGRPLDVYRDEGYWLLPKYSIQVDHAGQSTDYDKVIGIVWNFADKNLEVASAECQ